LTICNAYFLFVTVSVIWLETLLLVYRNVIDYTF